MAKLRGSAAPIHYAQEGLTNSNGVAGEADSKNTSQSPSYLNRGGGIFDNTVQNLISRSKAANLNQSNAPNNLGLKVAGTTNASVASKPSTNVRNTTNLNLSERSKSLQ